MEHTVLKKGSPGYPARLQERLGDKAPDRIHTHGPLGLLNRFTLAVACSDTITGLGLRATNQLLFTIREYEFNYVGGWHSVMETEIFRLGLFRPNTTVTLFSAKGLTHETYESYLKDRFYPPLDDFPERDEYFRRAQANELLVLSAVDPSTSRTTRRNVVERNLLACALGDAVFIPFGPKGTKTYRLAVQVAKMGWPVFTLDDELAKDLHLLGIPGFSRSSVGDFLEELGAHLALEPREPETEQLTSDRPRTRTSRFRTPDQQSLPFMREKPPEPETDD